MKDIKENEPNATSTLRINSEYSKLVSSLSNQEYEITMILIIKKRRDKIYRNE